MTAAAQLELFASANRMPTNADVGIRKGPPEGPGRLVAALVRRGLAEEDLLAAAALVMALDEEAKP